MVWNVKEIYNTMNPTMLKGEQMSDLQNKWIELDEIIQSIAGRNTER